MEKVIVNDVTLVNRAATSAGPGRPTKLKVPAVKSPRPCADWTTIGVAPALDIISGIWNTICVVLLLSGVITALSMPRVTVSVPMNKLEP
jgi:hypothetical protein